MSSNLPPGCTFAEIERHFGGESPCGICHRWPEHSDASQECTCKECPRCGSCGDPRCYNIGPCGGLAGPVPSHDAATCEVCTPPKGDCPKHGAYPLADGCERCMAEDLGWGAP